MVYDQDYEQEYNEIREKNEVYLGEFWKDLVDSGLKERTANRHCQNVDFYINTYLLREGPLEMAYGVNSDIISDYLGDFFIRKCMWSTPSTIKSTATSIKKFYKCMLQRGYINETAYRELIGTIKDNMDSWLDDCEVYNDPSADNPFRFF